MPFNEKDIGAIDINVRKAKVGDKEAFKKLIEENKIYKIYIRRYGYEIFY